MRLALLATSLAFVAGCQATLENMSIPELRREGEASYGSGNYTRTVDASTEILRRKPDDGKASLMRAMAWEASGNYTQALGGYEEASATDPANPLPRVRRAELHLKLGHIGTARSELSDVAAYPMSLAHEAHYYLAVGNVAMAEANFSAAGVAFDRAADAASSTADADLRGVHQEALKGSAAAWFQQARYPEAYRSFSEYAELKTSDGWDLDEEDHYWLTVLAFFSQDFEVAHEHAAYLSAESRARAAEGLGDPTFFN